MSLSRRHPLFPFTLRKIIAFVFFIAFQYPRILKYKLLSNAVNIAGRVKLHQPAQINGRGQIVFGENVTIGFRNSPGACDGYAYIDARSPDSKISIGDNTWINNNFTVISEGQGVEIGKDCLIGHNVEIIDTDFHSIDPGCRRGGEYAKAKVIIGDNVFIASNVKIMKGVEIGKNSVVANGSICVKNVPDNVVVGGNPATIIKQL